MFAHLPFWSSNNSSENQSIFGVLKAREDGGLCDALPLQWLPPLPASFPHLTPPGVKVTCWFGDVNLLQLSAKKLVFQSYSHILN